MDCREKARLLSEYQRATAYCEAVTALQQDRETSPPTVYERLHQRIEEARRHSARVACPGSAAWSASLLKE